MNCTDITTHTRVIFLHGAVPLRASDCTCHACIIGAASRTLHLACALTTLALLGLATAEPRFVDGVSTKREKSFVVEEYLPELEGQGWSLAGPVNALWGGERDLEALKEASEVRSCA